MGETTNAGNDLPGPKNNKTNRIVNIKCQQCDCEFSHQPNEYPGRIYVQKGEMLCEYCLMGMGVMPDHLDSSHTRLLTDQATFLVAPYQSLTGR